MSNAKTLEGAVKTEEGVAVNGILLSPIVDKCDTCDRIREFEDQKFCSSYPNPARKWATGRSRRLHEGQPAEGVQARRARPLKKTSTDLYPYTALQRARMRPFFLSKTMAMPFVPGSHARRTDKSAENRPGHSGSHGPAREIRHAEKHVQNLSVRQTGHGY